MAQNPKTFNIIIQYLYSICEESVLNGDILYLTVLEDIDELKKLIIPLHQKIEIQNNWLIGYQRALNLAKNEHSVNLLTFNSFSF